MRAYAEDRDIVAAIKSGQLKPRKVGVKQFEVRYFADIQPHGDECDLVSVIYDEDGRKFGPFMHCDRAVTDEPGDVIEGIGAEYEDGTTTSYLSDDPCLMTMVARIVGELR